MRAPRVHVDGAPVLDVQLVQRALQRLGAAQRHREGVRLELEAPAQDVARQAQHLRACSATHALGTAEIECQQDIGSEPFNPVTGCRVAPQDADSDMPDRALSETKSLLLFILALNIVRS